MEKYFRLFLASNTFFVMVNKLWLCVLLFTMIGFSFGQVVARNVFSTGFMWIDEVLRIEVLWITFIGAALATEYKQHIKIDFLANVVKSEYAKDSINTGAQIFSMLICFFLFAVSAEYVLIMTESPTYNLFPKLPDWCFLLVIPYCFFVMSIRNSANILKIFFFKDVNEKTNLETIGDLIDKDEGL